MSRLRLWPGRNNPLTFVRGMDTFTAPNLLPDGAHPLLRNVSLTRRGAIAKRWGYSAYGGVLGTTGDMGLHELIRNDATSYVLRIGDDGKLYKKTTSTWTKIPIRLATPYDVTATEAGSGAVGANLANSTLYQYAYVAVDAAGKTMGSTNIDADDGQVTTDGAANPITVTCKGVYKAVTYEVWRRTFSGTWGAWGRMTSGLTHSTANAVTTVTYTDDGNTAPDTGQTYPASNTTDHTMSTTQRTDWVTSRQSGNNVAFFTNGVGICWTDGTSAQLIQPAILNPSGGALTENRLWDATSAAWTCRGIHSHHGYGFVCDAPSEPQRFYFFDGGNNWTYMPNLSTITDPYALGGRILDFITKDDALVVATTTGVDVLWGTLFSPTAFSLTTAGDRQVFFSRVSDRGVLSEWSLTPGPGGSLLYLDRTKRIRELIAISPVKEQVVERELPGGQSIRPTSDDLSDGANSAAYYDGDQYILAFPADLQVIRVYFFEGSRGRTDAPVLDVMPNGLSGWLKLADGTLLASDADSGQLWQMYVEDTITDNSAAISMHVRTASLGLGSDVSEKDVERMYLILGSDLGYDVAVNVSVGNEGETVSATVSSLAVGVYAAAEDSATGAEYGVDTYDTTLVLAREVDVGLGGHFVTVEFTNDAVDERPIIYGFYFEFRSLGTPSGEE